MTNVRTLRLALLLGCAMTLSQPVLAAGDEGDAGAYLAARQAQASGDYAAAAQYFAQALVADPTNVTLLEGAVVSQIALGDFDMAAQIARRMVQAQARNQTSYIALLADQLKREAWDEAMADIAAGQSVGSLVDQLITAWAEVGRGQMTEALAGFDKLANSPGLEAFGLYHKALALALVGDFEGADEILSGRAKGTLRLTRRGAIAQAEVLSQLERNADALAYLDTEFAAGDPEIDALRDRLKAGETLPFTTVRNAVDGEAEVFFTLATALNGEAADGYTLLYSRVAMHLRPDLTEAVLLTAGLLDQQRQYDLATSVYDQVPRDNPAFHAAEIGRAQSLYAAGKVEAAVEALTQLGKSHSKLLSVHLALGDLLRREERYAEAIPAYDRAIALIGTPEARHWSVFYSRAICLEREDRWDAAEADFRQALALNPEQPQVLNYLGYSLVEKGMKLDEALEMIETAAAAEPNSGYIIDSLAWVYFKLGRYGDAVEPMERASLLEPVDPIVTDHLGDVYWAVGRTLEARFQWRRALSFGPEENEADRIRRKLDIGLDAVLAEEGAAPLKAVDAAQNGN